MADREQTQDESTNEGTNESTNESAEETPARSTVVDLHPPRETAPPAPKEPEPQDSGHYWTTILGVALVLSLLVNAYQYLGGQALEAQVSNARRQAQQAAGELRDARAAMSASEASVSELREQFGTVGQISESIRSSLAELDALTRVATGAEPASEVDDAAGAVVPEVVEEAAAVEPEVVAEPEVVSEPEVAAQPEVSEPSAIVEPEVAQETPTEPIEDTTPAAAAPPVEPEEVVAEETPAIDPAVTEPIAVDTPAPAEGRAFEGQPPEPLSGEVFDSSAPRIPNLVAPFEAESPSVLDLVDEIQSPTAVPAAPAEEGFAPGFVEEMEQRTREQAERLRDFARDRAPAQ